MKSVAVCAFAKINLDLRVFGRRPDGYHELRTVFQSLDLHDTVMCAARRGPFTVQCSAPGVPLDTTNLVWGAASALWRALGREGDLRDVVVTIEKRIPLGGGLGGGSANAAAALMGLTRLWGVAVSREDLHGVAATIGADVPFFLWGGTALGLGRGDEIYPLEDSGPLWVVLIVPAFDISTARAYEWFDADVRDGVAPEHAVTEAPWITRRLHPINDLEAPVARRHPEVIAMKAALKAVGAVATAMSGSGSCVYGLFDRRSKAAAALPRLERTGWQPVLTRTLSRAHYLSRMRAVRPAGPALGERPSRRRPT